MDRRRLWLDLENTEYIRETLGFRGCQIALRVDRDVIADDGTVRLSYTRYFITSVAPESITADELLAAVRNHWQVENSVFFLKDRWWDEDRHVCRRPGLAAGFTALLSAALSVLRATGCQAAAGSMRGAADALDQDIGRAIRLLTGSTS